MNFEKYYEISCESMLGELKKFKTFKEEILTLLSFQEKKLNEICKKIHKNISYEKDKQLFKNHLGYVFLAMNATSPNLGIYNNFRHKLVEIGN